MPFIRHKIRFATKDLKERKSFTKSPVFYMGVFLTLFLMITVAVDSKPNSKSLSLRDFSFLTASVMAQFSSQDLFAEPVKNINTEPLETTILQQNSLVAVIPPVVAANPRVLGSVVGDFEGYEGERKGITEYVVEPGDTSASIADKFNISVNTILWANDLGAKTKLKIGQKLIILPVSGVLYHVKKGDTLGGIAGTYKGKAEEIISANELSGEGDIFVGDILIIPNGKMPAKPAYAAQPEIPVGSSYFIKPCSNCKITQGLHWYNAIDFAGNCGDPVYAAAAGVVQKIKYGWNGGAGNYITILHPNGVTTYYTHLSSALASAGQEVSQGQIVALMGGKPGTPGAGNSTGCHVHFETRGAGNPFAR